jgi:hypothetical protein
VYIREDSTTLTLNNEGDIPTSIKITSKNDKTLSKITIGDQEITGIGIKTFDSKTGLITDGESVISYNGNGLVQLPVGKTILELTGDDGSAWNIEYYPQYY